MSISTSRSPTDDELQRAAGESGVEFVDGEFREKNLSREARRVTARIVHFVTGAAIASRAGEVYIELGYHCFADDPRSFRKPDASYIRTGRVPPEGADADLVSIPADLAIEVISPNDLAYEVDRKVREYLTAGFGCVWIVNPEERSVRVHLADRTSRTLHGDDEITGEPFLPTFRCRVSAFFE